MSRPLLLFWDEMLLLPGCWDSIFNFFLSQLTEKLYKSLGYSTRLLRFTVPFPLFAYPFYLVRELIICNFKTCVLCQCHGLCFFCWMTSQWSRSPGKKGSHFNPYSNLFTPNERKDVITSTLCWSLMAALLIYSSCAIGPIQMLKLYGVPHLVGETSFACW